MNKRINNRIPRIDFKTLESTILCSIDTEFSFARGIDSTQGVIKQQFEKKTTTIRKLLSSNKQQSNCLHSSVLKQS